MSGRLPSPLLGALLLATLPVPDARGFEIPTVVDSPAPALERAQDLVVMVTADSGGHVRRGAGVVFAADADRALIATSLHLLGAGDDDAALGTVAVQFHMTHGRSHPARIEMSRQNFHGVAVLSVDLAAAGPPLHKGFHFDLVDDPDSLRRGSPLFTVGHSHGREWAVPFEADLVDRLEDTIQFQSASLGEGSLGTAVFDDHWRLLGMLMQEATPPTVYAVRIGPLLAYLRSAGLPVYLGRPGGSHPAGVHPRLPPLPRIDPKPETLSLLAREVRYLPSIGNVQWLFPNIPSGRSASVSFGGSPDFRLEVMTRDRQRRRTKILASGVDPMRLSADQLGGGADVRIVVEHAANDEEITDWRTVSFDELRRGVRVRLRILPDVFFRYPDLPGDHRSIGLSLHALPD